MKVVALIPHYNHAATVGQVAQAMRAQGLPVLIVDDGSEPAAQQVLRDLAAADAQIQVVWRAQNGGKGAAVKSGFAAAAAAGHSHVLQVDADAQHQLADAQKLLQAAFRQPEALVCAEPVYGADAPKSRLYGRKITNFWIWVNTGSRDIRDGMCGFRLYPLAPVQALMQRHHIGERMDFDTDILVRLYSGRRADGVGAHARALQRPRGVAFSCLARQLADFQNARAAVFCHAVATYGR